MTARPSTLLRTVAPVVFLAVAATGPLVRLGGISAGTVTVTLLLSATALLRHRAPELGLGLAMVLLLGWWAINDLAPMQLLPAGVVVFWLLAVIAERRDTRTTVVAAAVVTTIPVSVVLVTVAGAPSGQVVVPLTAAVVIAVVVGRNRRTHRAYLQALEDRADRAEAERDARSQVAVADERARIAREVHDVVAHNISVMTALADGAGYALDAAGGAPPAARAAVAQVATTGRQAIAEMHRLLAVLRSDDDGAGDAPAPGLAQLDRLVDTVRAAGLAVTVTVTGTPVALPATAQLAVHRLVQEALTNTLTHAVDARGAEVLLRWGPAELEVRVTDDGRPTAAPADPDRRPGHGLVGMRERFGAWGGSVATGPAAEGGWRIRATLPYPADAPPPDREEVPV